MVQCIQPLSVAISMKAIGQYFPVVLFVSIQNAVLSFEPVGNPLKYDHSLGSHLDLEIL